MEDEDKTPEQTTNEELEEMRQRVAELEALETKRKQKEEQDAKTQQRIRKYLAFLVSGLPLILGLGLFSLNPQYIGRIIFSCEGRGIPDDLCSQPCGWLMLVLFIFLLSASFLGIRGSFVLLKRNWHIAVILVFLLFTLPAIFLVFLGPAIIVIMETPGFGQ